MSEINSTANQLVLGKAVTYTEHYTPELLQAVPRSLSRDTLGLTEQLPFGGTDIWNGYELSWLNRNGKPNVAILRCSVPVDSPNLIESKSFKLYLNSFNQTRFDHWQDVAATLTSDLSKCAGKDVNLALYSMADVEGQPLASLAGLCIDNIDVKIDDYQPSPTLLSIEQTKVEETLSSNLLKSNCLITHQPDWASILIRYAGNKINHAQLLKYLISFRQHNEFHEQCVERIFCDIIKYCEPEKLTVYARYTRRGGLDINPFRSNFEAPYVDIRTPRQ